MTLLTLDELRGELERIIREHPDAVNPVEEPGGICVYTDPDDPTRHCIIGQLAADLGWELPTENVSASTTALLCHWPVTDAQAQWLDAAQAQADRNDDVPIPWGQIDLDAIEVPS